MKNVVKISMLMVIIAIAIVSCSKDDKEGKEKVKLESGAFNGRVVATVEGSSAIDDKIDYVVASSDLVITTSQVNYTYLGHGEYKSGGFTINLEAPESNKLSDIGDFFQNVLKVSGKVNYSNKDAQVTFILDFLALVEVSEELYMQGTFRNRTSDGTTMCVFVYTDSDVDATASPNITVSLKKGWNRLYYSSGKNEITTKNESDTKWYYTSH